VTGAAQGNCLQSRQHRRVVGPATPTVQTEAVAAAAYILHVKMDIIEFKRFAITGWSPSHVGITLLPDDGKGIGGQREDAPQVSVGKLCLADNSLQCFR